ncbi:LysR family transcriptional regulator [Brevibacillus reuszeri]|uniref:Transcriptional regulator n=1 Tax=Brevibacillus reuszeri TaxID=54915 RepID=A0A0K9YSM3_9BACL|nr:LysR family transcriptional regulator [Brevibacillus reuszeri]KNB71676.1 transcriptional regulator [Brevibacillus reuszeri]MED1855501.1 LysR family transcriptional regulator [Brevibacillus reuszeri]GED67349.1 LysR family transcriptional regulator [Brevibacillus reuszeri]
MDQQLLVFVTVADRQNFSRAAEELHMTQPAVSQYILSLERAVGTKLLERSNKYVRLNKAGEIVYHHAREILGLYTRMQSLVDDLMNTPSGHLTIGASYTYGEYVLPHVIARMRQHYPLITPTITIHNSTVITELVANRQLDVGIVEGEFLQEKMCVEPFADDRMYLIVSPAHPLAKKEEVNVSELLDETWIVREEGSGTREAAEKMFRMLQIQPKKQMEFGSTQVIKEAVEAGLGISLLSYWAIRKERKLGTLCTLKVAGTPVTRDFSLVTKTKEFHTKALDIFMDLIRTHLPEGTYM